jgi:hypothetical protein
MMMEFAWLVVGRMISSPEHVAACGARSNVAG